MLKKYKILLSAYACEPNRGSEPGVGWHWALEIANRGHEVWVLTRKNNQSVIQSYFQTNEKLPNLNFLYYDVPKWLSFWKKGGRGVHLYYFLWQLGILSLAIKLHKKQYFDFIHHITFVTIHQPSFLFLLKNIPFFYGPTAGGDIIKRRFLKSFPLMQRIKEELRYKQCKLLNIDPIRRMMFSKSNLIFCNSSQTKSFLPKNNLNKVNLNLAIGVENLILKGKQKKTSEVFNVLYVGNFQHLKGLHLGIKGFYKSAALFSSKLTLIGKGNIDDFATETLIKKNLEVISWMPQNELLNSYHKYDILLFPSFRDSGGMVVLEAMSQGLPVICLDLGGPGQIVNETCGRVITTKGKSEDELIKALSNTILELQENPSLLNQLSAGALKRAAEFTWEKTVGNVYEEIELFMEKNN